MASALLANDDQQLADVLPAVDEIFVSYAKQKRVPGIAMGIVRDGKLVHTLYYGHAQIPSHGTVLNPSNMSPLRPSSTSADAHTIQAEASGAITAVTQETRFRIASMTKSFTALAVLLLRDAGRLSLDDELSVVLPRHERLWLRLRPTSDSAALTVRGLLEMTVGLPQDDPYADRLLHLDEQAFGALLDQMTATALSSAPSTRWEYSNMSYGMLGLVISAVAGMPFSEYITQAILRPLGMLNTHWDVDDVPAEHRAHGYRSVRVDECRDGEEIEKRHVWLEEEPLHHGVLGAMGGLWTTIPDFCKYMRLHLSAWPARDEAEAPPAMQDSTEAGQAAQIRRATLREMHSARNFAALNVKRCLVECYAYGLRWCRHDSGIWWIRHGGGLPGYGSEWRALPEHGLAIVALSNLTYGRMFKLNEIVLDLLCKANVIEKPGRLRQPSNLLVDRQAQVISFLKNPAGHCGDEAFAFNFFLDRSLCLWQRKIETKLKHIGGIHEQTAIQPENNLRGTFFLVGPTGRRLRVFFSLSPEVLPKIQSLTLTLLDS